MDHKQWKKVIISIAYAALVLTAYFTMPSNPDQITGPVELVTGFRIVSASTMSVFWGFMGLILGIFWDKTKPHETSTIAAMWDGRKGDLARPTLHFSHIDPAV